MATIKHISSKNADYGAAEAYLTFEHDEFTMKPTLDEAGRLIPRQDYRLDTLNCGEEDFALSCIRANLRYGKNSKREDIKSHHYIISFDPRDAADNGLTVDRAQALGLAYCKEHFPGHQALVCTHPDGHNHSGNIHVHIVINSLRIAEVERKPYMDRASDTRAGNKHRCTAAAMRYFRSEVMEMCHREGLYQIDLLNGSRNKVTEREYWAKRKGQAKLDKENAVLLAEGIAPRQTKFETDKGRLRQTIRQALATAASFDEFSALLLREGVTVKESRGRLSYLTPDRTKPITARKLGTDFDKAAVLAVFQQNAHRAAAKMQDRQEHQPQLTKGIQRTKPAQITPNPDSPQRLVDIAAKRAEGKGIGYERWAKVFNLKQLSQAVLYLKEHGDMGYEDLLEKANAATTNFNTLSVQIKDLESKMNANAELQKQIVNYAKTRAVYVEYRKAGYSKKFRTEHEAEILLHQAAKNHFDELGIKKLPSVKSLREEYTDLLEQKRKAYSAYKQAKNDMKELHNVRANVEYLLEISSPPQPQRSTEKSRQ